MRLAICFCALTTLLAGTTFAAEPPSRLSVGAKVGFGSVGMPGLLTGDRVLDLGLVFQRRVSKTSSIIGGASYQGVPGVGYADVPMRSYRGHLLSGFIGSKTRVLQNHQSPYIGATVGLTRWSARPGDTGLSPTVGTMVGAE